MGSNEKGKARGDMSKSGSHMFTATMHNGVVVNQSILVTRSGLHMISLAVNKIISPQLPIELGTFGKVFSSSIAVKSGF